MRRNTFSSPALLAPVVVSLLAVACGGGNQGSTAPSSVVAPGEIAVGNDGTSVAAAAKGGANKVAICHIEGNGTFHLLEISASAKSAHLKHGDVEPLNGACPGPATTTVRR